MSIFFGQSSGDATVDDLVVTGSTTLAGNIDMASATPNLDSSAVTLLLNAITNKPITTGTGLFTAGGALTATGVLTGASLVCTAGASFGGGYGDTGASISTAGVGQFNGALTTDGALTADGLITGGAGMGLTGNLTIGSGALITTPETITTDTTPDVSGANSIIIGAWTTANDITVFDGGTAGQTLMVLGGDNDCNIVDGANMHLVSDTTWNAATGATLVLHTWDGTNWYELSRSAT